MYVQNLYFTFVCCVIFLLVLVLACCFESFQLYYIFMFLMLQRLMFILLSDIVPILVLFSCTILTWFILCDIALQLIIYTKKLLNSDWLRKECSSSVTRVQNV